MSDGCIEQEQFLPSGKKLSQLLNINKKIIDILIALFCTKCGKENNNTNQFCGECGEMLKKMVQDTSSREEQEEVYLGGFSSLSTSLIFSPYSRRP